jgi:hypothetical protein
MVRSTNRGFATQTGAVFLMNVTSIEEARALMEELPLGKAALMKHEFIELGPLTPLHLLLTDGGATVLSPSGIFSPPFEAAVNPCRFSCLCWNLTVIKWLPER